METFHSLESAAAVIRSAVVSIGNFDGVHLGHQAILSAARRWADRDAVPVVVVTFEPHPLAILRPDHAPPRLTTLDERLTLLRACGGDAAVVLESTPRLLAVEALDFLRQVVRSLKPRAFVEGASFNFGRGRTGSTATLQAHAAELGYEFETAPTAVCDSLADRPAVSSSAIRAALAAGDVVRAAAMLGRWHCVTGVVGRGAGRGAGLGTPTANLDRIPQMVPAEGVYAGLIQFADGTRRLAATSVGRQPTFDDPTFRVEAHVLDFVGELRGMQVRHHFLARLREIRKFADPGELQTQIRADVERVRAHAAVLDEPWRGGAGRV